MKKGSTLLLKAAICAIGAAVLAICISIIVEFVTKGFGAPTEVGSASFYPAITAILLSAIPFYVVLYQAFKILIYIDKNIAFSDLSVKALKNIKHGAIAISALYLAVTPFLYQWAQFDDAPGVLMLGLIVIFISGSIATFTGVLQKLLKNVIDIKKENDLTV